MIVRVAAILTLLLCGIATAGPATRPSHSADYDAVRQSMIRHVGQLEQALARTNQLLEHATDSWTAVIAGERTAAKKSFDAEHAKLTKLERNRWVRVALFCQRLFWTIVVTTTVLYMLAIVLGFFGPATFAYRMSTVLVRLLPLGGLIRVFHAAHITLPATAVVAPPAAVVS